MNKIRQRARKLLDPDNPNSQYISIPAANFQDVAYAPYDVTRDAILKEKRIEMAGEFDRWFEIARLGILSERMASVYKNAPVEQPSGKIRERGKYFRKGNISYSSGRDIYFQWGNRTEFWILKWRVVL